MSIDLNNIDLSYYPEKEEEKNERQATFLSLKIMIELEKVRKQKRMKYSEIAEKLDKPYKTIERHLKILKEINAILYKGSKKAGGYEITSSLSGK